MFRTIFTTLWPIWDFEGFDSELIVLAETLSCLIFLILAKIPIWWYPRLCKTSQSFSAWLIKWVEQGPKRSRGQLGWRWWPVWGIQHHTWLECLSLLDLKKNIAHVESFVNLSVSLYFLSSLSLSSSLYFCSFMIFE